MASTNAIITITMSALLLRQSSVNAVYNQKIQSFNDVSQIG